MSLCEHNKTHPNTFDISSSLRQRLDAFYAFVMTRIKTHRVYAERRDAFKTLLRLDARTLQDIGLCHDDIIWAARLPLHIDASDAVQKRRTSAAKRQVRNISPANGVCSGRPYS